MATTASPPLDDFASVVAENKVAELKCFRFARAFGSDDLAWASGKEKASNEQVDCMVDGTSLCGAGRP
jgi:hypothetical protein